MATKKSVAENREEKWKFWHTLRMICEHTQIVQHRFLFFFNFSLQKNKDTGKMFAHSNPPLIKQPQTQIVFIKLTPGYRYHGHTLYEMPTSAVVRALRHWHMVSDMWQVASLVQNLGVKIWNQSINAENNFINYVQRWQKHWKKNRRDIHQIINKEDHIT